MKRFYALSLTVLLFACACSSSAGEYVHQPVLYPMAQEPSPQAVAPVNFARDTADTLLHTLITDDMNDFEKVQAVYRYLVTSVYSASPAGLDMWRYLSDQETIPTYVENRSLSPMLYQIGACEDFAAAVVVLCQQMDLEAQYVAGYILSAEGNYISHAWAVVNLEDNWYHVDPQFEQTVTVNDILTYRYFLKTDNELIADHKWGDNLIAYWPNITQADTDYIRAYYSTPRCITPYPRPEPEPVALPECPDFMALQQQIEAEKRGSGKWGQLPELVLDVEPPGLIAAQLTHANTFSPAAYLQYGRGFLSGEQQRLYDDLFESAVNWQVPFSLAVPDALSDSEALEVIASLLYDNPQLYWVQPLLEYDSQNGIRSLELTLVSGLTLEEAQKRDQEIAEATAALLGQLSGSRSQQLYQIHDYLAEHLYYEGDPAYADSANIYGGLINRQVICDGYAKTFQYLMHQINLDCIYIQGNSPGGASHAWNAVHLEDGWYYIDVTWDVNKSARTQIFHDYCAITLEEMALEHIWDPAQYPALPPSNGTAYNYYIQSAYALSPDLSQDLTRQLANTFINQLKDRQIPDSWQPVFLEIKILSDTDTYERVKAHFISEIYPLLETMQLEATASGLPFAIRTGETITCNFNDTLQILNLYPVVQAD